MRSGLVADETTSRSLTQSGHERHGIVAVRRIAFLKAQDHANCGDDYSRDLRLAKWGSEVSLHRDFIKGVAGSVVVWSLACTQFCLRGRQAEL